ncbi:MAG TPA: hypothetical protein PKA00_23435, partial [Saprospiraceae bacterium]|nr:hypothetical protein [Saprospiraceae bacterium]HMQ85882.1 hypothetical protein [Saprospiraceae bacterium]
MKGQIQECTVDNDQLLSVACGTCLNPSSSATCEETIHYSVDQAHLDHHPELTVYLNFHFIRKDDGSGNFRKPGESAIPNAAYGGYGIAIANALLGHINVRLGDFEQYNQSAAAYVPESRIRFELYSEPGNPNDPYGGIFFHDSSDDYSDINSADHKNNYTVYEDRVVDVFFIEIPLPPDPQMEFPPFVFTSGAAPAPSCRGRCTVIGMYSDETTDTSMYPSTERNFVAYKATVIHEVFHNLGLRHSFYCENECRDIDINTAADCNAPPLECSPDPNGNGCSAYVGPSNNIMSHGPNTKALTPCQLGILRHYLITRCPEYLKYDFCEVTSPDIVIQSGENIEWMSQRHLRSNIVVKPGGTLRIACEVGMPEDAYVRVEPGGKLVLDGGILTRNCDGGKWEGIEVQGTGTHQFAESQQGVAELINGAAVEYANIGVSVQDGGGILRADGASFLNNRWGVVFYNYVYQLQPGFELQNRSYVKNSSFNLTSDDYPYDAFFAHAYVGLVNGVRFEGCSFSDARDLNQLPSVAQEQNLPRGIRSEGARFTAADCTFTGLLYGIDAQGFGEARHFYATGNTFTGCYTGISARAVDHFQVLTDNNFVIGQYNEPVPASIQHPYNQVGLFIDVCTGFEVRDNEFSGAGVGGVQSIGICSRNTNVTENEFILSDFNKIYRNSFNNLGIANLANGNNQGAAPTGGLTYLCNQNGITGVNSFDIRVNQGTVAFNQIDPNQVAAGNRFTHCTSGFTHIDNLEGNSIQYYFFDGASFEEPVCSNPVLVEVISANQNNCNEGISDEVIDEGDLGEIKDKFEADKQLALSRKLAFDQLLDNGDKATMLNLIATTTILNRNSRTSTLTGYSPWLSQEVLGAVLYHNVFTSSQKLQILGANPEVLRRGKFWEEIEASNKFNATQLNTLEQSRQQVTSRENTELQLSTAFARLHQTANRLIVHYQSGDLHFDSLHYYLGEGLSLERDMRQVEVYLQEGNTTAAQGKLQDVANSYEFDVLTDAIYEDWKTLRELHISLIQSSRDWKGLTSNELTGVQQIASNGQGKA